MTYHRPLPIRFSATSLLVLALAAGCGDDTGTFTGLAPAARLMVFSDPHYFAPAFTRPGAGSDAYPEQGGKMVEVSDAVMRALVGLAEVEKPDIVLVAGDLTKDGERASHEAAAAYFRQMEAGGRRVFVVPGNHDIQNGLAESYAGDTATEVPTISAAEFESLYVDAGYGEALARDPASLSYVAELQPGLWLLGIDSCIYGDTRGSSTTAGRITEATQAWIKTQLDLAKRRGSRVIAMMHHGLVEHFGNQTLLFAEFVVADRVAIAKLLSEGGVGAVFTGHFHANDITQYVVPGQTKPIFDIETGSAVTYPCPYRIVDLASDTLTIATRHITSIDYALGDTPDFQSLARDGLRSGVAEMLADLLQTPPYALPADRAAALAPWLGDGLMAHYEGDEVMPAEVRAQSQSLFASSSTVEALAGAMLQSIWTDLPTADNNIMIDLSKSK
jgi:predicted phosphodiesterase